MDLPGLPPPHPGSLPQGPGCPWGGGGGDSSFLWSRAPLPTQNSSRKYFCPSDQRGLGSSDQGGKAAKAWGQGGGMPPARPALSVTALMAGEDVEVAVSPWVVGGNALKDDISGGETEAEVSRAGKACGHIHTASGASEGEAGAPRPTCGPRALGRSLSRL